MMGPRMGMGPDGFGPRPLLRGPGEYLFVSLCNINFVLIPLKKVLN
jgi:hypothetical protein